MVGGSINGLKVEVYSPDGMCQHNLAPLPVSLNEPVPAYIDNKIFVCGGSGNRNCYHYCSNNDTWSVYAIANTSHGQHRGEVFNNKIFLADDLNPEVFDPILNSWSSWPTPLNKTGYGSSLVEWKDTFILFGGSSNKRGIQVFNHSSNTWQVLDSSSVPMDLYFS